MAGELFDADKWREEQRDKNIVDTVTALASLLTVLLAILFVVSF